jgi:molybdopterin converting factor small subunit
VIVRLLLFAVARDIVGRNSVEIELPDVPSIGAVRAGLIHNYPRLASLGKHLMFSINARYAGDDQLVQADDEIACLPPVSGG